jgi:hypothetical protein
LNCRSIKTADGGHGFKPLGTKFPTNSIGWYRRTFELPADDSGKRIWLTFDGVMRDATVWVNGWCVRRHEGGYYPFREDITDVVHFGGRTPSPCAWMRPNPRAGFTKARASTATSGWTRPRRWPSRRMGFLCRRVFKNNVPKDTAEIAVELRC